MELLPCGEASRRRHFQPPGGSALSETVPKLRLTSTRGSRRLEIGSEALPVSPASLPSAPAAHLRQERIVPLVSERGGAQPSFYVVISHHIRM